VVPLARRYASSVAGEANTVLAEADYDSIMEYVSTYAWHVEHAEQKAAGS
jgi:hypothetical protein